MPGLTIDLEFVAMMSKLTDAVKAELDGSISAEGCRDPIVVWGCDGKTIIVDGHNRYEICQRKGIPFKTVELSLKTREEVKEWIIRNQMAKRNLILFQQIEAVVCLEEVLTKRAKEDRTAGRQKKDLMNSSKQVNTRKEMASLAGVSEQTYGRAKEIIKNGTEQEKKSLSNGDLTINKVYTSMEQRLQKAAALLDKNDVSESSEKNESDVRNDICEGIAAAFNHSKVLLKGVMKRIADIPVEEREGIELLVDGHLKWITEIRARMTINTDKNENLKEHDEK